MHLWNTNQWDSLARKNIKSVDEEQKQQGKDNGSDDKQASCRTVAERSSLEPNARVVSHSYSRVTCIGQYDSTYKEQWLDLPTACSTENPK
jgi:hypothetical protein